ncbi:MAG: DUF4382 domain-containing protein [Acidobacteriota bacterium]
MTSLIKQKGLPLLVVLLVGLIGCSSGGDTGRLSLSMIDKPSDDYLAVYVTIAEIDVHAAGDAEGAWTAIATPNKTIDLLALANGVREELALADLAAGRYSQMRLIIGTTADSGLNILGGSHPYANYVIDAGEAAREMKIPSGLQTGVKLVQGFTINANSTTELTFDFDASRSVVVAGRSGHYLLKPTIQVIDTAVATVINGTVTRQADGGFVGGALVSVQAYDAAAADPKDQVAVLTSTLTDDTDAARGRYKFFFAVDAATTINLVASKEGLASSALRFLIENGNAYTKDFALADAADAGAVDLTIEGANADAPVTLSFRRQVVLDGETVMIEVLSKNYVNGAYPPDEAYRVPLPAGDYTVVASTADKATLMLTVSVAKDAHSALDVKFL